MLLTHRSHRSPLTQSLSVRLLVFEYVVHRGPEVGGYDCGDHLGHHMYPVVSFSSRYLEAVVGQLFHLRQVIVHQFLK